MKLTDLRDCTHKPGTASKAAACTLGLVLSAGWLCAQEVGKTPELKPNPLATLRSLEPDANQEYQLGRGDEISIEVIGRPELSRKYVVGPDGRVTLPLAGPVLLVDTTREQAAKTIEQALSTYFTQVTVNVGVDKYTSNHVLLLGSVEHQGLMSFDQPPTLLQVLARSGGESGQSGSTQGNGGGYGGASSSAGRGPVMPDRCAIYRGSDQVMWVDVKGLLDSGSSLADLRLKRDDVIYVPSQSDRYVSVLGQVLHPGAVPLDSSTTLPKLLALSGGVTLQAGNDPKIQIISPTTGKTWVIAYSQVLMPTRLDLTLHPGDIVLVPESGFNKASYTLQQLSPLVTMFAAASLFLR